MTAAKTAVLAKSFTNALSSYQGLLEFVSVTAFPMGLLTKLRPQSGPGPTFEEVAVPMAQPPAAQVIKLRKGYGYYPVLWDLDLEVGWGECVVLLGANGAGKTTLLKVLSTQARADEGSVRIAGLDAISQGEQVRRVVGVVSHQHLLYEDLTAAENLLFYGRMYGLADLPTLIRQTLTRVGLERRADHRVRTLSNGQQKRLSIGRAILHQPKLLLLDEPESGLDPAGRRALGDLVRDWKGEGKSVLMATHNVDQGLEWADRVALLFEGKISFIDDPRHLGQDALTGHRLSAIGVAP